MELFFGEYDPNRADRFGQVSSRTIFMLLRTAVDKSRRPLETKTAALEQYAVLKAFHAICDEIEVQRPDGMLDFDYVLKPAGIKTLELTPAQFASLKADWEAFRSALGAGAAQVVVAVDEFLESGL